MAALNITLILWAVIVITMTIIISVKLFRQEDSLSHSHANDNVLEIGGEQEELYVSNQDS